MNSHPTKYDPALFEELHLRIWSQVLADRWAQAERWSIALAGAAVQRRYDFQGMPSVAGDLFVQRFDRLPNAADGPIAPHLSPIQAAAMAGAWHGAADWIVANRDAVAAQVDLCATCGHADDHLDSRPGCSACADAWSIGQKAHPCLGSDIVSAMTELEYHAWRETGIRPAAAIAADQATTEGTPR